MVMDVVKVMNTTTATNAPSAMNVTNATKVRRARSSVHYNEGVIFMARRRADPAPALSLHEVGSPYSVFQNRSATVP